MPRCIACSIATLRLVLFVVCLVAELVAAPPAWATDEVGRWVDEAAQFGQGARQNVVMEGDALRMGGDPSFRSELYGPEPYFGLYDAPARSLERGFNRVWGRVDADVPAGSSLLWQVRASWDGQRWTEWQDVPTAGRAVAIPTGGRYVQYRLIFRSASPTVSPIVRRVELVVEAEGTVEEPLMAASTAPTVRVWATREGLVDSRTANGHVIQKNDEFVALPSVRALSSNGGWEYAVRLRNPRNGREAVAPVWDVGPWNIYDNYWDPFRELFGDLPRWLPEAQAAYFNGYNGGLDQYGRHVCIPPAIDIADGTFWNKLGMTDSDWVDVTFLWLSAASPPLGGMPAVTAKPYLAGFVEAPGDGATVSGSTLQVTGWVVDRGNLCGTSINGVRVYLDGPKGQGTYLGSVTYGLYRPDVAQAFGKPTSDARFANSGYSGTFNIANVAPGTHTLYVYAVEARSGVEWLAGQRSFARSITPIISGSPSSLRLASGQLGAVTVRWDTGDGGVGQVWVSMDGLPEVLFAEGVSGSQVAGWIQAPHTYTFRLYRGRDHSRMLGSATVVASLP
jgi:hypothetical protein